MNKNVACRFCSGTLIRILSLGMMPIVNYFPAKEELPQEKKYPLQVWICKSCSLVQLCPVIPAVQTFRKYHYASGASAPLVAHLNSLAKQCANLLSKKNAKVLDIGCNDGWFLASMRERGFFTLGVDPAVDVVQLARSKGVEVINEFFTKALAGKIKKTHGVFDLIVMTHTLANIIDIKDFFTGVATVISADGVLVIEVGSLEEMVRTTQFDAIYHEHYSYFSLTSLRSILDTYGFSIYKTEQLPIQGGSIRVYARREVRRTMYEGHNLQPRSENVTLREMREFAKSVREYRKEFRKLFASLKGRRIVGFGAPAKGVTLMNYCNISRNVAYIIDSTLYKQGRFLPGIGVPVLAEEYLWQDTSPDYVVLLAWNYQKELIEKLRKKLPSTVRVIIPFPKLRVVSLS